MLTENDAVEVETTEEIIVTDTPMAVDEAETAVQHADDAADLAPVAASESETEPVPEPKGESESDILAVLVIEPLQKDELKPDEPDQPKRRSERRNERRKKGKKPKPDPALAKVVAEFAACGRCSFFLAGYRVAGGEGALAAAVGQQAVGQQDVGQHNDKWLTLSWSQAIADLVHKSYGSRVDIDHFHYEGHCQECLRSFVYHKPEDDGTPTFRIERGA